MHREAKTTCVAKQRESLAAWAAGGVQGDGRRAEFVLSRLQRAHLSVQANAERPGGHRKDSRGEEHRNLEGGRKAWGAGTRHDQRENLGARTAPLERARPSQLEHDRRRHRSLLRLVRAEAQQPEWVEPRQPARVEAR